MIGTRGPGGGRHLPEYRPGCYYRRAEDCCPACMLRMILEQVAILVGIEPDRNAPDRDLAGTQVVVPAFHRANGDGGVDYVHGEITDKTGAKQDSTVCSVRLDDGELLTIAVERVE